MNWQSINFDWNQARAFLVTAQEGSLSAAARALGMTQPTLGRQVSALEQALGVVLFDRVAGRLVLTPSGLELVEHVRAMGDAANQVSLTASGQSAQIDGTICISVSEVLAAYWLPPILAALRRTEPGIDIELIATNNTSDLGRREADIAIRSYRPTQPDLIARKIKDVPVRLYATPVYLRQIGTPRVKADLQGADFIGFDRSDSLLTGLNTLGLNLTKRHFSVLSENQLVQWSLVKQGLGVGLMTAQIGDAEPLVTRALADLEPLTFPLWLVAQRELRTSRRVRTVFDFLRSELMKINVD